MSEKIEIRSANPDDYDTIIKLFNNNQDKEFAMRYYKVFFNNRNCCPHDEVLVKVVEGKIVGVIGYCPDRLETDDIYWLGWFYVHKDCRGHGYGRELLDYVIDILKNKPARKLYVDTSSFTSYEKAMEIYEKTGFAYEGTLKDYYEKGEDQIILGKYLNDNANSNTKGRYNVEEKMVVVEWERLLNNEDVIKLEDENEDSGLYQITGYHPVFGDDSLLYIGKATKQTFSERFEQHEPWLKHESDIAIYVGRVTSFEGEEWEKIIDDVEPLLIYFHSPPYNSQHVSEPPNPEIRLRIINTGDCGDLYTELSHIGLEQYDKYRPKQKI